MAMPSVCFKRAVRLEQAGMFVRRQINLRFVAGDDRLGAVAEPREKHQHLLGRRILRLVQNDEGVVQGAPAHVGQRRDLNRRRVPCVSGFPRRAACRAARRAADADKA